MTRNLTKKHENALKKLEKSVKAVAFD